MIMFWLAQRAVCHGPAALAYAKVDGEYLIKGQPVTGFSNSEEDGKIFERDRSIFYPCTADIHLDRSRSADQVHAVQARGCSQREQRRQVREGRQGLGRVRQIWTQRQALDWSEPCFR